MSMFSWLKGNSGQKVVETPNTPEAAVQRLFEAVSSLSLAVRSADAMGFMNTLTGGKSIKGFESVPNTARKLQESARAKLAEAIPHVRGFLSGGDSAVETLTLAEIDTRLKAWKMANPSDNTAVEVIMELFAGGNKDIGEMIKGQIEQANLLGALRGARERQQRL